MAGSLLISGVIVAVLGLLSLLANRRFSSLSELPMQFGLNGKPTWTAPRAVALSFTPGLAGVVLLLLLATRAGTVPRGRLVTVLVGAAFLGAHVFHLWLIDRAARR